MNPKVRTYLIDITRLDYKTTFYSDLVRASLPAEFFEISGDLEAQLSLRPVSFLVNVS